MKPIILIDHFRAGLDTNGNPKRIYRITAIMPTPAGYQRHYYFDEGYGGRGVFAKLLADEFPHAAAIFEQGAIDITPGEYRALKKLANAQDTQEQLFPRQGSERLSS